MAGKEAAVFPIEDSDTGRRGALPWVILAWKAYVEGAGSGQVDFLIP